MSPKGLGMVSIAVIKNHDQMQVREERVYLGLYILSHSLLREAKAGTQGLNLKADETKAACWLAL